MWETYIPVFRACVDFAQAAHVMCSYNSINGIPTCGDPKLLNGILRDQWEWPGFVVSDYDAWANIQRTHQFCPNMTCAAATGLNAGLDQEGGGTGAISALQDAITAGMTTKEAVTTAFKRLFRIRLLLGMHDPPTSVEWNFLQNETIVENEAHFALARVAGQKAMTLYRNEKNTLPLSTSIKKLALIGPSAVQDQLLLGNYAAHPDTSIPTIRDGILEALGLDPSKFTGNCSQIEANVDFFNQDGCGVVQTTSAEECCRQCGLNDQCKYFTWVTGGSCYMKTSDDGRRQSTGRYSAQCLSHFGENAITYVPGCADIECNSTSGFQDAVDGAKDAEAIVLVLGLDQVQEREGHDRSVIELPGNQYQLFDTLRKAYPQKQLIVVLVHGGTLALGDITTRADAILDAWYPGCQVSMGSETFPKLLLSGNHE